ncbi:MAG: hypothetical protein HKN30_08670 [Sulfitobacter sp.]|nr:hypothetical protein [Sulfitobacter sp.]
MSELSLLSQAILYVLLAAIGLFSVVILWFQMNVFRGKRMPNPDGSADDWHQQRIFYGIAIADILLACPLGIATVVLVLFGSPWGFYLLPAHGFYFLWANTMTTATSLRFHNPEFTLMWFIVFPLGALVGAATLIWSAVHFAEILGA